MKWFFPLALLLALPEIAMAQVPATGRILVATPALADPNFSETVVLLVHHGEDGSLGVFLNRPTWVDGADPFPDLAVLEEQTRTLFLGGPVQMTQLLILTSSARTTEGLSPLLDGVQLTTDIALVTDTLRGSADSLRLFAGHTAWATGQLEAEIDDGYWRVVDGSAALIFSDDPANLWERARGLAESGVTARLTRPPQPLPD